MAQATVTDRVLDEAKSGLSDTARNSASPAPVHGERSSRELTQPPPLTVAQAGGRGNRGIGRWTFLAGVVLPFLLACFYYGWLATPQYISEARFAVRTLGTDERASDIDDVKKSASLLRTKPLKQDAYVVTSFIHSTEILGRLSGKIDFLKLFSGNEIDYLSRLPADHTLEELEDYWDDQVLTYLDGPSGIVTLKVRAFSPQDAKNIADAIIHESERLANELSERARADYVKRAGKEVADRHADYRKVLDELNTLRNETAILDPQIQARETNTLLTGLMAEKLDTDARLFVLEQQAATDSPAARQLHGKQAALEGQISDLRSRLAASETSDSNLSNTLRRFSELEVERVLASELYGAARRNLVQAQADAIRKAVYVTVFVQPDLAGESRYPRRVAMPLMILLGLTLAWSIAALLWASINDNRI